MLVLDSIIMVMILLIDKITPLCHFDEQFCSRMPLHKVSGGDTAAYV